MVSIVSPRFRPAIAIALLLSWPAAGFSAAPGGPSDSTRVQRIAKLGELWGEIRYRHPWLAYKSIDWDSALVAALPKVEAAPDSGAYARVVGEMIGAIGDPATRLAPSVPADSTSHAMERPFVAWNGNVLVVNLAAAGKPDFVLDQELRSLEDQIPKAKSVVVDARLRAVPNFWPEPTLSRVLPMLYSGELRIPGGRYVQYSGYPTQSGPSSGSYTLGFESLAGKILPGTPGIKPGRLVVILDELTPVPAAVLALKQRGLASLVTEGDVNDASAVLTRVRDAGEGVHVEYRIQEFEIPLEAEARVPRRAANARDLALEKAVGLARAAGSRRKTAASATLPPAVWRPDRTYSETPYPDRAHRQLAAIRFWNVIQLFYPYQHLLDGTWDSALQRNLPRFEAAKDDREYAMAVLEMATLVKDGHTRVFGGRVQDVIGRGPEVALDALEIEGKPVIVSVGASAAAAGVQAGDIIEAVDGEAMDQRMRRLEPYLTAATPAATRRRVIVQALYGADSSAVTLKLRGASGTKEAKVARSWNEYREMLRSSESYKMLPRNVGYVRMEQLQVGEVEEMFRKFQDTRAIIFDIRGYPNGTVWSIAPRINTRGAKVGAVFERVLTTEWEPVRLKFEQKLLTANGPVYRGRTLTLIDERAISHAEHTCLFFEAANGTTFVGSPTAGANGDVTRLSLPGGLSVMFTGHDVRHADGRQLQRVGIQPDVPVRPTIAGVRAGRDEVLERALAVLDEKGAAARGR